MNIYLIIKFHEDFKNKKLIQDILKSLESKENKITVMAKDFEKWGKVKYNPQDLMKLTFKIIDKSDLLLVEFSEKGVGLGIEAGYACAKKIPIIVIAKNGSEISDTLKGISKEIFFYKNPNELKEKLKKYIF